MKTAILGAGVSGLALARYLVEGGVALSDVHLFESAPVAGGLCRSRVVDGFTYDVSGGHILFSKDAGTMQWMKERAGGDDAFVRRDRHTRIRWWDHWVRYPFENGLGDLPKQANFDCLEGYVRAWHERRSTSSSAPGDFASWVRWRFGDGIAKHFMDPYNEKIWKRPLETITSDWVAGRVPDAPVEDVLRASIGIETEGYTHQAIFFYPKEGGFQAITDGMAAELAPQVRLSTPATDVTRHGEGWRVDGEDFDCVVSTIPLNLVPDVVRDVPGDVAGAMRALEYNSTCCILVALDRPEHPDLSWVYLPFPEQGPTNRVTYMSNYAPGNAPEGRTSLMCEVTSPGGAPYPPDSVMAEVVDGLVFSGLCTREEVLFTDRCDNRFAYIVYDADFGAKKRRSIEWMEEQGLHPLGRFGHYEYDNSDQCVMRAKALAQRMLERAERGSAKG